MATRGKLSTEKDADLVKAILKASGGIKGGAGFWSRVAEAMDEDINGEAARKRFDKFKPGATSTTGKAKVSPEKDADLLKAVLTVHGGIGKGKAFWEAVAASMDESIKADAARKRFDKFRVKAIVPPGDGNAKAVTPKEVSEKRVIAKPKGAKGVRGAAKGKKALQKREVVAKEGHEDTEPEHSVDDFEIAISKEDGGTGPEQRIQDSKVFDNYIKEGKGHTFEEKRGFVEEWVDSNSGTGNDDSNDEQFDVETPPIKPPAKTAGRPIKKRKLGQSESNHEI